MSKIIYDPSLVASLAQAAHAARRPMSEAVANRYGVTRRNASKAIARARLAGYNIPLDFAAASSPRADEPAATRSTRPTLAQTAITREEYYARPDPKPVVTRHNSIGHLLAGDFR